MIWIGIGCAIVVGNFSLDELIKNISLTYKYFPYISPLTIK